VLAAWVAALVFGIHPVHTEAIDSFFNSSEIIATLGSYGALWLLWSEGDRRPALAWTGAAVIFLATLFCRESAIALPVLAVLVLWSLPRRGDRRPRVRKLLPVVVLALPLAVYALLRTALVPWPIWAGDRLTAYLGWRSWGERLATSVSTTADAV